MSPLNAFPRFLCSRISAEIEYWNISANLFNILHFAAIVTRLTYLNPILETKWVRNPPEWFYLYLLHKWLSSSYQTFFFFHIVSVYAESKLSRTKIYFLNFWLILLECLDISARRTSVMTWWTIYLCFLSDDISAFSEVASINFKFFNAFKHV